ncbi:hypothetical protein SAMN05428978_11255 [Nitrosomonas sp. Nm34]|nr:hypothetical protein SAMN05428978_11255 [Nitrosomonas sp. Nm34]
MAAGLLALIDIRKTNTNAEAQFSLHFSQMMELLFIMIEDKMLNLGNICFLATIAIIFNSELVTYLIQWF